MDFTPELRAMALEQVSDIKLGPIFTPRVSTEDPQYRATAQCPSATGGTNIPGGPVLDPESGILYVQSRKACTGGVLGPASERDDGTPGQNPGSTVVDFTSAQGGGFGSIQGVPIFKPPYGRITAIDMNTGETLWWIPNGDTPEEIANNPLLEGVDLPNTGRQSDATVLVTRSLLMFAEGRGGQAKWFGVDKDTGERIGEVEIPASSSTAPMTFLHEGVQYIVVPIAGNGVPGSLAALRLP